MRGRECAYSSLDLAPSDRLCADSQAQDRRFESCRAHHSVGAYNLCVGVSIRLGHKNRPTKVRKSI